MSVPFIDIDSGDTMRSLKPGQDRALECTKTLMQVRDLIADLGERPLKAVLFLAVYDDEDGTIDGAVAGNRAAIEDAFDFLGNSMDDAR